MSFFVKLCCIFWGSAVKCPKACLLGAGLPLLGYGASISCASQRDLRTNIFLQKLVQDYEDLKSYGGTRNCDVDVFH